VEIFIHASRKTKKTVITRSVFFLDSSEINFTEFKLKIIGSKVNKGMKYRLWTPSIQTLPTGVQDKYIIIKVPKYTARQIKTAKILELFENLISRG